MKDNILVIIACRGGSKGIKGKNIIPLAGLPLIAHSIMQAIRWSKAVHVIVSTDSKRIARVARRYGAETPFVRPAHLASDNVGKLPVLRHALNGCEKIYNTKFDIVVDLDATSPIRTRQDLDNCLNLFLRYRPDTLFSVVRAHKNPYFNMVELDKKGNVRLCKRLNRPILRRQDVPPVYNMNASIYFYKRSYLLDPRHNSPISNNSRAYIMTDLAGIDIDREIDFKFIEFLLKEGIFKI